MDAPIRRKNGIEYSGMGAAEIIGVVVAPLISNGLIDRERARGGIIIHVQRATS